MVQGKRKRAKKAVAKKAVAKKRAPRPVYTSTRKSMVPLSDAVTVGNLIFVSGTTPFDGEGRIARGDFAAQMHQVMANIKAILAAAGSSLESVAKVVVILTRLEDFRQMNEIYRQYFKEGNAPARTTIGAQLAHPDFLIEIECVAQLE